MSVNNESVGDVDGPPLSDPLGVSRIRPAYEQVADQLRELIVTGTLKQGERLPATPELASMFGVGRSTVREALRQLSSQNLINAVRGSKGGTFVTISDADSVRRYLETTIGLMSGSNQLSMNELFEARLILEGEGAYLAAQRRSDKHIAQLREAMLYEREMLESGQRGTQFGRDFHAALLEASGNRVLQVMTMPVFRALTARMSRRPPGHTFWDIIDEEHKSIFQCVLDQDADGAGAAMRAHLLRLREVYNTNWSDLKVSLRLR
jgi:GntR family transcriptional regulator, transcriptional repressor for pyruvate dehydrogenase complex